MASPCYRRSHEATGPARLINTTEIPSVVFFIASAHVFYYKKNSSKSRREKSQEKIQAKKKAGPEAPENSYKKPIQNSKQQRGRLRRPPQKWGGAFAIFGAVVINFELVF